MKQHIVISLIALGIIICYIIISLFLFMGIYIPFKQIPEEEIYKKTVSPLGPKDENCIIVKSVKTTGFNYRLIRDENGKRYSDELCLVTGNVPEHTLEYEYHLANTYVCYVTEKKQYYSEISGYTTEYVVNDWDVLYPSKHVGSPFNFAPGYVLKSDCFNLN